MRDGSKFCGAKETDLSVLQTLAAQQPIGSERSLLVGGGNTLETILIVVIVNISGIDKYVI